MCNELTWEEEQDIQDYKIWLAEWQTPPCQDGGARCKVILTDSRGQESSKGWETLEYAAHQVEIGRYDRQLGEKGWIRFIGEGGELLHLYTAEFGWMEKS
jgi:hypothetical protein